MFKFLKNFIRTKSNNFDEVVKDAELSYGKDTVRAILNEYSVNCLEQISGTDEQYMDTNMLYAVYRLAWYFEMMEFVRVCRDDDDLHTLCEFKEKYENPGMLWQKCFMHDLCKFTKEEKIPVKRILSYDRNGSDHTRPHCSYIATSTEVDGNYYIRTVMLHSGPFIVRFYPNKVIVRCNNPVNGRPRVVLNISYSQYKISYKVTCGSGILNDPKKPANRKMINDVQAIVYCVTNGQFIPYIERMQLPFYTKKFKHCNYFKAAEFYDSFVLDICNIDEYMLNQKQSYFNDMYAALDINSFRIFVNNCMIERALIYSGNPGDKTNIPKLVRYILRKLFLALNARLSMKASPQEEMFILRVLMPECMNSIQKTFPEYEFESLTSFSMKQLYKDLQFITGSSNSRMKTIENSYNKRRTFWNNQSSILIKYPKIQSE